MRENDNEREREKCSWVQEFFIKREIETRRRTEKRIYKESFTKLRMTKRERVIQN